MLRAAGAEHNKQLSGAHQQVKVRMHHTGSLQLLCSLAPDSLVCLVPLCLPCQHMSAHSQICTCCCAAAPCMHLHEDEGVEHKRVALRLARLGRGIHLQERLHCAKPQRLLARGRHAMSFAESSVHAISMMVEPMLDKAPRWSTGPYSQTSRCGRDLSAAHPALVQQFISRS